MADTYFNPTVIVMIVEDNPNVLSRISLMFGQRGFNIDTITASHTHDDRFTRITITTHGDQDVIDRIVRQTQKMVEVHKVAVQTAGTHIERELLLAKIEVNTEDRSSVREICEIYHADIVEMTRTSMPIVPTPIVFAASMIALSICDTRETVPWKVGQKTAKKITATAASRNVANTMIR